MLFVNSKILNFSGIRLFGKCLADWTTTELAAQMKMSDVADGVLAAVVSASFPLI